MTIRPCCNHMTKLYSYTFDIIYLIIFGSEMFVVDLIFTIIPAHKINGDAMFQNSTLRMCP